MKVQKRKSRRAPGGATTAKNERRVLEPAFFIVDVGGDKILGYTKEGIIMLLVTVLTLGFGGFIMGLIGLIEGIIYLTKSDEDFVATYINNKKGWF